MAAPQNDVTVLLQAWAGGDSEALAELMPLVFEDLRSMARSRFRGEPEAHTLQPTALVNEVFLRLTGQHSMHWESRNQFFAFAGTLMRRILVDHAKGRRAAKRGKGLANLPLDEGIGLVKESSVDLVALDQALTRLSKLDERQARIVELRFFVGLTNEEIADLLGISSTSVKRDWQTAKLWLFRELSGKSPETSKP